MSKLKIRRQNLSRLRWLAIGSAAALTVSAVALVSAGNHPLPSTGSPHGTGISHNQYPDGYKLNGHFTPSFDNYIDYSNGAANDERPFLGARVVSPNPLPADGSFETRKKLEVKPGDKLTVSAFVHNDAGTSGNNNGNGPSVAKNTRVYFNFPTGQSATELQLSSYVRANNAVVNDQNLNQHTISDNMSFLSKDGTPIKLKFIDGSGRLLQTMMAQNQNNTNYQVWNFTHNQEYWMFTGNRTNVGGNTEEDPHLGLPIGSDGSFKSTHSVGVNQSDILDWFGCEIFHGYVQFQVMVEQGQITTPTPAPSMTPTPTSTPTPSMTPTPTSTPTPSMTPTPSESPSPTPTPCIEVSPTPTPTATPTPEMSPTPTPEECVSPTPSTPSTPSSPPKGPSSPPAQELPKTGGAQAAMVSAIALAISGYLYLRERRALKGALKKSRVK